MPKGSLLPLKAVQRTLLVVLQRLVIMGRKVQTHHILDFLQFLDVCLAHKGGEIEVECGYGLAAVHLVLCRLQGYAGDDGGRLDTLGGTRLAMSRHEAVTQDAVQGMLHTSQRLGRVVVLVVDVYVITVDRLPGLVAEQVVVDERLSGL